MRLLLRQGGNLGEEALLSQTARLFGASEDEIMETALIAKNTMGWSTYLNTLQFDYEAFVAEFDQVTAHVRQQMAAGAPA